MCDNLEFYHSFHMSCHAVFMVSIDYEIKCFKMSTKSVTRIQTCSKKKGVRK